MSISNEQKFKNQNVALRIELAVKARELKIEARLEKVRAVALKMKKPAHMLDVCKTIALQLQSLGVKEIRNVQTAIFYEARGTYMNYQFYAKHDKTFVTETVYTDHKVGKAFAKKMLRGKGEVSVTHINGEKKVKEWLVYQKSTNVFIDRFLEKAGSLHYYWHSLGPVALGISTYSLLNKEELNLFNRFVNVFELAYKIYLDIQQAEAQAKEVQIELALERVRARTMAMKKSEELQDATLVLFRQFKELGATTAQVSICIFDDEIKNGEMYLTLKGEKIDRSYIMELDKEVYVMKKAKKAFLDKQKNFSQVITGKKLQDYNRWRNTLTERKGWDESDAVIKQSWHVNGVFFSRGMLGISSSSPASEEAQKLLERFAGVFDGTYTRFLDLQKAEAQARESQIQLALERVRARTMAMQKSDELAEAATLVFQQFSSLGLLPEGSRVFFSLIDEDTVTSEVWTTKEDGILRPGSHRVSLEANKHLLDVYESWKGRKSIYNRELTGSKLTDYLKYIASVPYLKEDKKLQQLVIAPPDRLVFTEAFFAQGTIGVIGVIPLTQESQNTLMRFSKVFEQTYTRFLDLQKAETQAREAQIELALERVRARAMSMQNSNELSELVDTVFKELTKLDFALTWCIINIIDENSMSNTVWAANPDINKAPESYHLLFEDYPFHHAMMKGWKERKTKYVYTLEGSEKKTYDEYLFTKTEFRRVPEAAQSASRAMEKYVVTFSFSNFGGLQTVGDVPLSDANLDILSRFGKVFDLTYTRFNDLKLAESQAREAQVELALERVRARTMAMQKSDELSETAYILYQQFKVLGQDPEQLTIGIINEQERMIELWMTLHGKYMAQMIPVSIDEPFVTSKIYAAFKQQKKSLVIELSGKDLKAYNDYRNSIKTGIKVNNDRTEKRRVINFAFFSKGQLSIAAPEPLSDEGKLLLERFAAVFDGTYTRFLDLQKAEAQAKEAQIEAALERVRSRTMGMQKSEELKEVIQVVFDQFIHLNIRVDHTGFVMDYKTRDDHYIWIADQIGAPSQVTIPYFDSVYYNQFNEAKEKGLDFFVSDLTFEEKNQFYHELFKHVPGLPEGSKKFLLSCPGLAASTVLLENVGLYIENFSGIPFTDEENSTLMRFGKVFQQTYTRFLDLQKAEAQAREAQIENAIEKVRSRTMAMQKSDELGEVVAILFDMMNKLGIRSDGININIIREGTKDFESWLAAPGQSYAVCFLVPYFSNPVIDHIFSAIEAKKELFTHVYSFEEKNSFFSHLYKKTGYKNLPEDRKRMILESRSWEVSIAFAKNTALSLHSYSGNVFSDSENEILKRFAKVFEQTYTRFLDLQKAEAQAREAKIEAALEKVRSRTMAMQRSDELEEAAALLFQQVKALGVPAYSCGYNIWGKNEKEFTSWMSSQDGSNINGIPDIPLTEDANFIRYVESKQKGEPFFVLELRDKRMQEHYAYLKRIPAFKGYFDYAVSVGFDLPETQIHHIANFSQGNLLFITLDTCPEFHDVFKRFAAVFEQTYTRFLDLQKAEAQAREAKIEASLEKVRSRTMAMQRSDELSETAAVLFQEFKKLGEKDLLQITIGIYNEAERLIEFRVTSWAGGGEQVNRAFNLSIDEPTLLKPVFTAWKEQKKSIVVDLTGQKLEEWLQYRNKNTGITVRSEDTGGRRVITVAYFSKGHISFSSPEPRSPETVQLLERFAGVFDLTYTRFIDLKKAEANAREAKIETSLERVRGKAMAMHSSEDLSETIAVFYRELKLLSIIPRRCGVALMDKGSRMAELTSISTTEQGDSVENLGKLEMSGHPLLDDVYQHWLEQKEYHGVLRGNEIKEYYKVLKPQISYPDYPHDVVQFGYYFMFKEGDVYAWTEEELKEEDLQIYRRFTTVLSLTYKRYKDLKDAEARAKDALKQASLDRIRADIASMRNINDLDRITPLIWNELTILGIPFIRCGVFIMDESQQLIHTFLSTPDGKAIAAFHLPYDTPGNIAQILSHWQEKKNYIDHWDEKSFTDFAHTLVKQGALASAEQYLKTFPRGGFYLHCLPFLQGMLYVGNTTQLGEDEIKLLQYVADAFATAYARYEDFNKLEAAKQQVDKTLVDLKQAQTQLVQSEKMASLGELTAGIAHEIQNPLNFVNNFSEVSNELIDEMITEMNNGNQEDAMAIADDVKQNLEKILHHGKRADGIVKGMLQHSRSSSATKEPTDINKLADEYLRLAYHGLRAKDKTFNASFKTDFDETIGKINIIPQDIGRVILNLITNAFYVVNEKKKQVGDGYEPIVSVSTKKINGKVEIKVADNGSGIPQKVLDKIFQPFFTTKPTGQGTGLGLSLSYDIVKAHSGELKVETKESKGSTFIIILPA